MYTPFPAARLSALTTIGKLTFFRKFFASSIFSKTPKFAVGILNFLQRFFVNIFEPSN